jgi:hypothetical protein
VFRITADVYRTEYHTPLQWNDSTNSNNFMKMNLPKLIEIQVIVHPVQQQLLFGIGKFRC